VWAWSIANEIASDTPGGVDFVQEMVRYVKSLDPSRPVGFACNRLSYHPENDATRLTDFVMMNQYIGTWAGAKDHLAPVLDAIHRAWPDRVVVISEFGFEPNWNATYTPSEFSANPGGFYTVPKGTHPNSPQVDQVRRQVIIDQMEVFRSQPFIAGAIFWTYQDYRTPTGFRMGVVDFERKHSLSWEEIRTQFAPAHLTGVEVLPPAAGAQKAILVIKTRGPLEEDMPVYTLRGYFLRYRVISPDGETVYSQGDTLLPSLAPATEWRGELEWTVPDVEYQVVLSLVRPTGYSVLDYKIVQLP
jgi:beta-glucuronidase